MLKLSTDLLQILLHEPGDGFYQGTRFDRSGLFHSALFGGVEVAAPWYEQYSPTMHDAVHGPAEEFSPIGFDRAAPGERFLKTGVGLLVRPDGEPYDRFRLYKVADPGRWTVASAPDHVTFRHEVPGYYEYTKEVALTGASGFVIRHALTARCPMKGDMYNHNFWTMGDLRVGPSRRIRFPFRPDGHWRAPGGHAELVEDGIRFLQPFRKGDVVYMGDIHRMGGDGMPYEMELSQDALAVSIRSDVPATHAVLWTNHRIACLEPYIGLDLVPGQTFRWEIRYGWSSR